MNGLRESIEDKENCDHQEKNNENDVTTAEMID